MPRKKQPANADGVGKLAREETRASKAVNKSHHHDTSLQEKLKQKDWDPLKEIIEITDEYEEGTPKRELKSSRDDWGACCLESQDVDVVQKTTKGKKR